MAEFVPVLTEQEYIRQNQVILIQTEAALGGVTISDSRDVDLVSRKDPDNDPFDARTPSSQQNPLFEVVYLCHGCRNDAECGCLRYISSTWVDEYRSECPNFRDHW